MAEEDKNETKSTSIGAAGMGISAVAGIGAGALATKAVVSSSVKSNLLAPYIEGTKAYFERLIRPFSSALNAGELTRAVEFEKDNVRHLVHEEFQLSGTAIAQDLADTDTLLGKAKAAVIEAESKGVSAPRAALAQKHYNALTGKAALAAELPPIAREPIYQDMWKMVQEQIHEVDLFNVAQKVKEIPWTARLNPFNKELHLTGAQKGLAVAAGAAVAIGAAFGVSKLIGWMSSGKESDQVSR